MSRHAYALAKSMCMVIPMEQILTEAPTERRCVAWWAIDGCGSRSTVTLMAPDIPWRTRSSAISKECKTAWIYWQPVEPESGWGLLNANYVDTDDQFRAKETTSLVRVNRKFYVYGQFTRYLRPGYRMLKVDDDSIAAFDPVKRNLVIIKVTGSSQNSVRYDLSRFK